MTELINFAQMWWQEILVSASILMFITGVSIKVSEGSNEPVKVSKHEWLERRNAVRDYRQEW